MMRILAPVVVWCVLSGTAPCEDRTGLFEDRSLLDLLVAEKVVGYQHHSDTGTYTITLLSDATKERVRRLIEPMGDELDFGQISETQEQKLSKLLRPNGIDVDASFANVSFVTRYGTDYLVVREWRSMREVLMPIQRIAIVTGEVPMAEPSHSTEPTPVFSRGISPPNVDRSADPMPDGPTPPVRKIHFAANGAEWYRFPSFLEGQWRITSAVSQGQEQSMYQGQVAEICGDRMVIASSTASNEYYLTFVDPLRDPIASDLAARRGTEEKRFACLLQIKGDSLILCRPKLNWRDRRPAGIDSASDPNLTVFTMERVSNGAPHNRSDEQAEPSD